MLVLRPMYLKKLQFEKQICVEATIHWCLMHFDNSVIVVSTLNYQLVAIVVLGISGPESVFCCLELNFQVMVVFVCVSVNREIQDPNVVKLFCHCVETSPFLMILEYCPIVR